VVRVVIVGGSFGGLTTAYKLRGRLAPRDCEIVLVTKDPRFVFIPSLPWVSMGSRTLEQISFDLARPLARKEVNLVHATVRRIDVERRTVHTDAEEISYDVLVVATGHRSANEAVSGLGPFDGPGHSLMSPPEAEEARDALAAFLETPGPMAVGCAPGASCIGPAYEFAFELDHLLRKRGIRHKVPINFVTPEPHLGHFGMGGVGKARQFLEGEFEQRDIRYRTSVAVSEITADSVRLADGLTLESGYSLVIPPLAGVDAVASSPGLANPKGFIPVDPYYRHPDHPEVYAVGVAVAMPPVEETPVPVNFPKTGQMTEQMATLAAHNICSEIQDRPAHTHELSAECILDMGDRAAHMKTDPVRPPRNRTALSDGRRWLWAKKAFERYYLAMARRGRTVSGGRGW